MIIHLKDKVKSKRPSHKILIASKINLGVIVLASLLTLIGQNSIIGASPLISIVPMMLIISIVILVVSITKFKIKNGGND